MTASSPQVKHKYLYKSWYLSLKTSFIEQKPYIKVALLLVKLDQSHWPTFAWQESKGSNLDCGQCWWKDHWPQLTQCHLSQMTYLRPDVQSPISCRSQAATLRRRDSFGVFRSSGNERTTNKHTVHERMRTITGVSIFKRDNTPQLPSKTPHLKSANKRVTSFTWKLLRKVSKFWPKIQKDRQPEHTIDPDSDFVWG